MNTHFRISEKEILVNQQLYKMENITSSTNTKKIETLQKTKHISEKLPSLAQRLGKRSGKESSLSHDLPSSSCNDSYNHTTFGFSVTDPIIATFLRHSYSDKF